MLADLQAQITDAEKVFGELKAEREALAKEKAELEAIKKSGGGASKELLDQVTKE